jgi:hypothetical protein
MHDTEKTAEGAIEAGLSDVASVAAGVEWKLLEKGSKHARD